MRTFKDLNEVREVARKSAERFREVFGLHPSVVITKEVKDEGMRLLDVIERDEGDPLIFNDKHEGEPLIFDNLIVKI